jgi:hypothetical protein
MKAFEIENGMGFVVVLAENTQEAKAKYMKWFKSENEQDADETITITETTETVFPLVGYGE